jgi:hypothetical protein
MPSIGFEPTNPEIKRLQTYALDCTMIVYNPNIVTYAIRSKWALRIKNNVRQFRPK